jgi:hypothetical protein
MSAAKAAGGENGTPRDDGTSGDGGISRTVAADERTTHVTDSSDSDPVVTRMLEIFQQMVAGQTAVAISERLEDIGAHRVQAGQLAALQALAQRMQAPDQGMDADQSRTEVRFRALQTSLGGAARVAHPNAPALMPSPRLYADRLEFVTNLPKDAWTVVLSSLVVRGKNEKLEDLEYPVSDRSPDDLVLTDLVGTVVAVEVRDVHDRTLQFGIPFRVNDRRTVSRRN